MCVGGGGRGGVEECAGGEYRRCNDHLQPQEVGTGTQFIRHPRAGSVDLWKHSCVFLDHLSELLEGQLEAAAVVGGALGGDVLHRLLQHPFVAHVGLHQILEAGGVLGLVVKLEGGQGRRDDGRQREGTCTYLSGNMWPVVCKVPETYMDVKFSKKDSHFKIKTNLNDTSWLCACMKTYLIKSAQTGGSCRGGEKGWQENRWNKKVGEKRTSHEKQQVKTDESRCSVTELRT